MRRLHISIITLNVNGLNLLLKRHRVADWIKKQSLITCCLQETHLSTKEKYRLKVTGWKMIFQENGIRRKVGVAVLISDKKRLQNKKGKERYRGTLHNDKENHAPRRHNTY